MKTTAKALVGWIAVAIILSARLAAAAPVCCTLPVWLATATAGQSAPAAEATKDKPQQAADLLRRARLAMTENNLSAADSLISQADALGVQYNVLYMGDTPKKARRDLERKRNSAAAVAGKPAQALAPLGLGRNAQAPTTDPFAGQAASPTTGPTSDDLNAARVTPLPRVNGAPPRRIPTNPIAPLAGPTAPAGSAAQAAAPSPLRAARLALAVGDARHAAELLQQARGMQTTYSPLDDTPEKVEMAIRKHQEMLGLDKNTEAYRRAYARNLMEQADALLRWGEADEAGRLADRASKVPIVYGPFEQKPQDLLQRVAAMRRQSAGSGSGMTAPGFAGVASAPNAAACQRAVELVRQAREAIAANQLDQAEMLARQAEQLQLPDSAFAPGEDRPGLVLLDLRQLRQRELSGVVPAGGQFATQAGGAGEANPSATRAVYDPANDPTRNVAASSMQAYRPDPRVAQNASPSPPMPAVPVPPPDPSVAPPAPGTTAKAPGMALFEQGEAALKAHDPARAYELFRQAASHRNDLDPITAQRLQDHLQLLSAPSRPSAPQPGATPTLADETTAKQQALARQVAMELAHRESSARAMREANPKGALLILEEARKKVEQSGLDPKTRDQLLARADRAINETNQLIEQNRPQLELAEKNARIHQEVDREQRMKVQIGEKLALLIDEFNRLMDEQRYEEAQVVAKRANELDPDNPVVVQVMWQAKFVRRFQENEFVKDQQEEGFITTLHRVDESAIPFDDKNPIVFPDAHDWGNLTKNRQKLAAQQKRARSEREIEIEKKLRTPVSLQFTDAPLSKVLENLAKMAEVNLHIDQSGLAEEGVTSDTTVTIELREEIMLKSALHLILEPLHLNYIIKDEVLKITSEAMRDGDVYKQVYNVADLVVPIPNFVPTSMGVESAYRNAMSAVGFNGGGVPFGSAQSTPMAVVANAQGKQSSAALNPSILAQMSSGGPSSLAANMKSTASSPGPGGLGGGAQADFDSLIELITATVKPETWEEVGGTGSIAPFETNLSIVVSQTQEVHEEIEDLLQQLRRLQDLQVTIEVRFITLNDNFFERIGVDFDFAINDNIDGKGVTFGQITSNSVSSGMTTGQAVERNVINQDSDRTVTVGMSAPGVFNADLDIPFTQNSYALAVPQFGGFDATAGASLGFAILSDIEAYFFINAAQGDRRSNVLQAPKVTLFNGQQASVFDQSQTPFVISVIPVVGDFAAAQQPVIVVLSEGTFMTVQAVVSNDRRFVRLTVVPFFSTIGDVRTFQFTGSSTTTTDTTREGLQSGATDPSKLWDRKVDDTTTTNTGTTVQLPTFAFVTVSTTVSVPDGGTVLLGGIKRLSEGRNEFGVPLLNKLPYINRLFRNVAIGRETQSLMMMVTPRIIIQEEEEEKIGILQEGR